MNITNIQEYIINRIEENLNLDYKAADSLQRNDRKTNEISKDISAFANSNGGIIIYGIKEDPVDRNFPGKIDPINRKEISKEWLEQIIQNKINPRIQGIKIHSILTEDGSDEVVYLVEIPQSDTAHQASDKKYYKRFNFNSEPMYDYEIRDILNRAKHPLISLEFEIEETVYEFSSQPSKSPIEFGYYNLGEPSSSKKNISTNYVLKIYARNSGKTLANYINAYVTIPQKNIKNPISRNNEYGQHFVENTTRDLIDSNLSSLKNTYGPSRFYPILPKMRFVLETIEVVQFFSDDLREISWIVYCDNSEAREGTISIKDITRKRIIKSS